MKAIGLKAEQMIDPIGLQTAAPMLSWVLDEGQQQCAYRITACVGGKMVWDSGKVESSLMMVPCSYTAKARERVMWSVEIWDEKGEAETSEAAFYEIALTDQSWRAKWIDPETEHDIAVRQPSSVLRKTFTVEQAGSARLYITCHGLYEARLNGKRVGNFVLAPGTDDYRVRLQYQTYDVTDLLHEGENEITVTLGDGWYRGNNGVDGLYNYYGSDLALLCQLEIENQVVLISDESWEASQEGPIRLNDLEKGEEYDARKETVEGWHGVTVKDYGLDTLTASNSVPILEQERFEGKLIQTPNGETVIDFGQNLAGYTAFEVEAKAGQTITLWHGETLDETATSLRATLTQESATRTEASRSASTTFARKVSTPTKRISSISGSATRRSKPMSI